MWIEIDIILGNPSSAPMLTGCPRLQILDEGGSDPLFKRYPEMFTPLAPGIFVPRQQKESSGAKQPRATTVLPKWTPRHWGA